MNNTINKFWGIAFIIWLLGMAVLVSILVFFVTQVYGAEYDECVGLLNSTDICDVLVPPLKIQSVQYSTETCFGDDTEWCDKLGNETKVLNLCIKYKVNMSQCNEIYGGPVERFNDTITNTNHSKY